MWRRALISLAIGVSLTACMGKSSTPPLAQYPHSPGDVAASGDRQVTRELRPRVATDLVRRQPELHTAHPTPLVGLMPVWLTPHRRDNGDVIGGQWLWIPSRSNLGPGPMAAPTAPTLEPIAVKSSQMAPTSPQATAKRADRSPSSALSRRAAAAAAASPPAGAGQARLPSQMQAQYRALRRSLGLPATEEGAP